MYINPLVFQNCSECWKGNYSPQKIYWVSTKKYMNNILNQKHPKFKPGQIAHPMSIGYAQALKTSEVCSIFWASLFCLEKK